MSARDDDGLLARLDGLIERLAAEGAPGVVARARAEAEDEAVALLRERLVAALVRHAADGRGLGEGGRPGAASHEPRAGTHESAADAGAGTGVGEASAAAGVGERVPGGGADDAGAAPGQDRRGAYLYGVTSSINERVVGLAGVDGSPTYGIPAGGVVAVASDLEARPRSWGVGPDGRADLELIAPHARAHELVLERVLEGGPVVPMRFGTMYPSADAVRAALAAGADALGAALDRLHGRTEWGLTVRWHPERADLVAAGDGGVGGQSPGGLGYLTRRSTERKLRAESDDRVGEVASGVHAAVSMAASEAARQPVRPGVQADGGGEEVLRGAYLVADEQRAGFEAAIVEALESWPGLGLEGELTGPWPPYSFAAIDLKGAAGE